MEQQLCFISITKQFTLAEKWKNRTKLQKRFNYFFLLLFLFHSKGKLSTFAQVVTSNSETIVIIETTTATNWQA